MTGAKDNGSIAATSVPQPEWLRVSVEAVLGCLIDGWPDDYAPTRALVRLRDRLRDMRFHLAVLGQFKRGKSTFINALLGVAVLPTGVLPLTAVPAFIAWGREPRLRVTYEGDRPTEEFQPTDIQSVYKQLRDFVTEAGNPTNTRGIARVDVMMPADILRDGVVLIDTPGVGSTLRHNTETAVHVLPECDAALFVVSADPPITEAEIAYLAKIRPHISTLFFVLNKIDYLEPAEREHVQSFLRRIVCESGAVACSPPIFQLSARQAIAARVNSDNQALAASGLTQIERQIVHYLSREKAATLQVSVRRKALTIADQSLADLNLRIRALELPLADLAQRAAAFAEVIRAVGNERRAAHDLLAGDRGRAVGELEAQAEHLREEGRAHVTAAAERAIAENGGRLDGGHAHRAIAEAIPAFFEAKLAEIAAAFRRNVEQLLARHQARSDALVASVRQAAADLFEVPFRAADASEPFRLGSDPYWVTQDQRGALVSSPASLIMQILPAGRRRRMRERLEVEIADLVRHNVENLRWSTLQGLNETFRRFAARLDDHLVDALAVTQGVIDAALQRRRTHAGQTAAELGRLQALFHRLESCRVDLSDAQE